MKRGCCPEIIKSIERALEELKHAKANIEELELEYENQRHLEFRKVYEKNANEVYSAYANRLALCCYQGSLGYDWWLPIKGYPHTDNYKPNYRHCIIDPHKYEEAQPTKMERDAFWVMHKKEMQVTEEMHREWREN